jgi:hypothetical protein
MATERQIEANRQNALKSRGPRTIEGKERSRQNALKHGLTAETLDVIPGEDAAAFAERIEDWTRVLEPRNQVEEFLVRRAATLSWKLDRSERHEVSALSRRIRQQAELDRGLHRERVTAMMGRLLPTLDDVQENGFDSESPRFLIQEIESTAHGCGWLLECWELIRQAVLQRTPWTHSEEMAILRLSGQGTSAIRDPESLRLLLASRVLFRSRPLGISDSWNGGPYGLSVDREAFQEAGRQTLTDEEARAILLAVVETKVARLRAIHEIREREGDQWGAEESAAIGSFDSSAEGQRLLRYQTTNHREMIRSLESVAKLRQQAARVEQLERRLEISPGMDASAEPITPEASLRNEPNSALNPAIQDEADSSSSVEPVIDGGKASKVDRLAEGAEPRSGTGAGHLRNEPNSDHEAAAPIGLTRIGKGGDRVPLPLRAAS